MAMVLERRRQPLDPRRCPVLSMLRVLRHRCRTIKELQLAEVACRIQWVPHRRPLVRQVLVVKDFKLQVR